MEPSEKELEDRLREVGNKLASPPSDVEELLELLDQTEIFLSRVEQSPSMSMSSALHPALKALVSKDFLNHLDTNVKVFVAACISEIIRITAPEAPYDDDLMKELFAVIVDSFGKLDDISSHSYPKRVSILETVAKVRSCVVMLDLECDGLILQMFKHFLNTIRPDHIMNIFTSMVTIMTHVLEESGHISQELVLCLLSNVQKSNKVVLPVASRLAEKVISNCAVKLKPYVLEAVQSISASLSDYGGIVASICQKNGGAPGQYEVNDSKLSERSVSDEFPQAFSVEAEKMDKVGSCLQEVEGSAGKSRKELDNGCITLGNGIPAVELSKHRSEHSCSSEQDRTDVSTKSETDDLSSVAVRAVNKQEFKEEVKSSKQLSSFQSTDASDSSWVDGEKEASEPPNKKSGHRKESKNLNVDASDKVKEIENSSESKSDIEPQSPEDCSDQKACVNPTSPSDTPHGSGRPKRSRPTKVQMSSKEGKAGKPASAASQKDHGTVNDLERKSTVVSVEKSQAVTSDMKSQRNVRKEAGKMVAETDSSSKQQKFAIKTTKVSIDPKMDVSGEPNLKDKVSSYRTSNAINDDQNHLRKILNTDSRKKRQRGKELDESEWNEVIVGSKIEVWWHDDKKFYKGMVDSFVPKTKKHKIVYDDGDVEILTLSNEHWKYVDDKKQGKVASYRTSNAMNDDQNHLRKSLNKDSRKKRERGEELQNESGRNEVIVGSKIEVWWHDDKKFYKGLVDTFDPKRKKHKVVYDDGDVEILTLSNERWKYVDDKKQVVDKVASFKTSNAMNDNQIHSRKILNIDSRKKHQKGKELDDSKWNEVIVGSKIEVWWHDDKKFYKGIVDAFDPKTKKHKVVYDDGDVEILTLLNERWKYVDDKKQGVEHEDIAGPELSLELPLKKRRASSGSSTKQGKAITSSESGSKSGRRPRDKPADHSSATPGNKPTVEPKVRPRRQTSNSTSKSRNNPKMKAEESDSSLMSNPDDDNLSDNGISKSRKEQDVSDVRKPEGDSSRSAGKTSKKRRK